MVRVLQPRPLVVLGLNVWMGTAAGADELVEIPYREFRPGPRRTPFILSTSTSLDERGHFRDQKNLSMRGKDRGDAERPSVHHLDLRRQVGQGPRTPPQVPPLSAYSIRTI